MIAMITDFGTEDLYVGVVKGAMKKVNPNCDIVDICHDVESFSISHGQYFLNASYRHFPRGTVFFVVVDPGVGTERKGIIALDDNYTYVLPDNGLISAVFQDGMRFFEIDYSLFKDVSATFHGRDVFAPVAAGLDAGKSPEDFGRPATDVIINKYPVYEKHNGYFTCMVQHSDKFWNVITSLPNEELALLDNKEFIIDYDNRIISAMLCKTYGDLEDGVLGIMEGSSGFVELAANRKTTISVSELNFTNGDEIRIKYKITV